MEMNQALSDMLTATDLNTSQVVFIKDIIVCINIVHGYQAEEIDPVSVGEETSDPALVKAISKMKKLDVKLADVTKVIVF